jgi:PAS domain S-box-containing protein
VKSAQSTRLRLAAQNGAVRALVHADSAQDATSELLREVCQNLGWTVGAYWQPSLDGEAVHNHAVWADPSADMPEFLDATRRLAFRRGEGIPGRVLDTGAPAWVEDVAMEPGFTRADAAARAGLHGAFAVPVPLGGGLPGVLEFFTREVLEPDEELLETMAAVGGYLGQFMQRRSAEAEHRRAEARLRFQARLLDAVGEAVMASDTQGRITYWNAFAEELFGWTAEEALGRDLTELKPARGQRARARQIMAGVLDGRPWTGELLVQHRSGREFPVLISDSPILDDDGQVVGIIGTSIDITQQKRREEGQRFLAEAGRVLASSLDYATTLRSVATLAVPFLGDLCLVHLYDSEGQLTTPVARILPGEGRSREERLEGLLTREGGLVHAALAGDSALLFPGGEPVPGLDEEEMGSLGIQSVIAVPLRARGSALGVMTFASTRSRRRHDLSDAAIAEELGRRAGLAIDNARLYREAEEGNRAKADFLAVVSHELRTPLNAIAGYADLLAGGIAGEMNQKQQRHVERIKVGAGHLAHLIDEILSYARVETGRETIRLEPTDVAEIAREAAVVIEPDARDKQLDVELDTPEAGLEILTDPAKVRQILVNLLSNAVKYTREGSVRVRVRGDGSGAVVEVHDTGVGIPREDYERIFEPFWQAQSPNTRSVGGTGIGLSVSRRLARLLEGELEVDSEVGVGSTFTVRLPDLSA